MDVHDLRAEASGSVHQRPFMRVEVPCVVSSITLSHAWHNSEGGGGEVSHLNASPRRPDYDADYEHLRSLCVLFSIPPPERGARFFEADLGGICTVRWERNTEVQTYTFNAPAKSDDEVARPFDHAPINNVPKHWLERLPGYVTSAVHVAVAEEKTLPNAPLGRFGIRHAVGKHFCGAQTITGCDVDRGRFRTYSDFRMHDDDFCRIVVVCADDGKPNRRTAAGKVVQRMIELDKYRVLSMMGLPFVRALTPRVDQLNAELEEVVDEVSKHLNRTDRDEMTQKDHVEEQRALLAKLTRITADALKLSKLSAHRMNASQAYAEIVDDRIDFLLMSRVEGLPSMSTFLQATSHPAIRTCKSVSRRLGEVLESSQVTAEMMRTSLTVEQQYQSNRMLDSQLDVAHTQLLLQECVEGLSVVAISYYGIGILGYGAKAAHALGLISVAPEVAVGVLVPFVGGAVFLALGRLKRIVSARAS